MKSLLIQLLSLLVLVAWTEAVTAQDVLPSPTAETPAPATPEAGSTAAEPSHSTGTPEVDEIVDTAKEKVGQIAQDVDQSATAKEAASGLLKHIYLLAENLSFPAFHWLAFAIMVTGVVSYTLQLVLAKLVVLTKLSLSFREILSDSLGLVISLIGLVLTTQAAAENSNFTHSPFAVLSATAAGIVVGFIFYRWGQMTEIEAAVGRRAEISGKKK